MDKNEIIPVLEDIAQLLEITGESTFKIRAYQNAARSLQTLEDDLDELIETNELQQVKGIGKAIAEKIQTLRETGELPYYQQLLAQVPQGLIEMTQIPGLGARKIKALYEQLGIDSIPALKHACESGKVENLEGFGTKTQKKLLEGIANREAYAKRHLWWDAWHLAQPIVEHLQSMDEVQAAECAGSLRRSKETVGDLDFIVSSNESIPIMEWFTRQEKVKEITAKGTTKSSVRFHDGIQADIRVVAPEQYAFALHHFTGSKEHNVLMRQRALRYGYSLSEWGLHASENKHEESQDTTSTLPSITSEDELFRALGLHLIPPELREGQEEVDYAEQGEAPALVQSNQIRGAFHNHTTASDGKNTLEEMAEAAAELGWEYLGIADHSKASYWANGLDEERLQEQIDRIDAYNASSNKQIHLFKGLECDIFSDGSLDMDESILRMLDYVVASVHQGFNQSEEDMTKRLIRALEHQCVTMLGHPTGRLLLRREPCAVNLHKVIDAAAANQKIIELNANPKRLDMDWRYWKRAAEKGVRCSINPDAHETKGLRYVEAGIRTARKGWLTPEHILNTYPLESVRARLNS